MLDEHIGNLRSQTMLQDPFLEHTALLGGILECDQKFPALVELFLASAAAIAGMFNNELDRMFPGT